jgi:hypothetical protein
MSNLVDRLTQGDHRIEVSLRPARTVQAFRESLDRGYVHIKFTDTKGGTELGVPIDSARTDLSSLDFAAETGQATIVGNLTLDYVKVRCVAQVHLPSLDGQGHLERVEA